ncbi:DUF6599 family protein [Carboxylicivirga taeanensis]|uniref:DUF6599 family protein n=1 Tax=Carboxylicivirga taeanensis TaxID=1416875 RepID=UPI003F6DCE20
MKNYILLIVYLVSTVAFAQEYPDEFSTIDGWSEVGEKQYYSADNLYDYINGASDFYLGYDFQDLWVVDYENDQGQLLTLELYRHADPLRAFGIYSEERPQAARMEAIGAQGFKEGGAIFFLADNYYAKVYNGRPEVSDAEFIDFAEQVARRICSTCYLPRQFQLFPAEGKIELSERFMPENFMGITGFNGVCTVKYSAAGERFSLFVFQGDDTSCQQLMTKYFERLKYKKKLKEKIYDFEDPYLGKVKIAYQRGVIAGVLDANRSEQQEALLATLLNALKGQ